MKYGTALRIIGDNPIGLLTWGQIIIPPANAKLSKIHLVVTMDHTGNELLQMLDGLDDHDRIHLMESIVSVDHMTVQPPRDPMERRKQHTLPWVVALSLIAVVMFLIVYDVMSKNSVMDGGSLSDLLKTLLGLIFGLITE